MKVGYGVSVKINAFPVFLSNFRISIDYPRAAEHHSKKLLVLRVPTDNHETTTAFT